MPTILIPGVKRLAPIQRIPVSSAIRTMGLVAGRTTPAAVWICYDNGAHCIAEYAGATEVSDRKPPSQLLRPWAWTT